ncbi:unnamed protein product [Cylicostephanus goldi]|uniref:Uncharacterized protein n=1 Tax=Cylicostephanus goldi TaxID=71465 RepID=A0A3P6TEB3_CYLGO|nr:unnamed protein product [Cylicostephanus goldi]
MEKIAKPVAVPGEEMSKSESASEYEIQYRSTIQPRTAVRSQSRQSGNYVSGGAGGGGGGERIPIIQFFEKKFTKNWPVLTNQRITCRMRNIPL